MGVHKKKPASPEQGLLPGVEVPGASGKSTEAKKSWLAGYEDARNGCDRSSGSAESAAYEEGYELGRKHGPKPPRHSGAHQRRAIASRRLQVGTPVEVLMLSRWVSGKVSHKGGDFFLFDGGECSAVTVDRPAYWRFPPGECSKCGKGIERGEDGVRVSWSSPKALEHENCGARARSVTDDYNG